MANLPIPADSLQHLKIAFAQDKVVCVNSYSLNGNFTPGWQDNTLSLEVKLSMEACTYYNFTFDEPQVRVSFSFISSHLVLVRSILVSLSDRFVRSGCVGRSVMWNVCAAEIVRGFA